MWIWWPDTNGLPRKSCSVLPFICSAFVIRIGGQISGTSRVSGKYDHSGDVILGWVISDFDAAYKYNVAVHLGHLEYPSFSIV